MSGLRAVWVIVLVPIFVVALVVGRPWDWGKSEKEKDSIKMEHTQMLKNDSLPNSVNQSAVLWPLSLISNKDSAKISIGSYLQTQLKQEARTGRDTKENHKQEDKDIKEDEDNYGNFKEDDKDDDKGLKSTKECLKTPLFTSLLLNRKDIKVDDKVEDNGRDIKENDKEEDNGRDITEDDKKMDPCLHTYTAHTPNLSFIKEKTVTFTINKCKNNQRQHLRQLKTGGGRRQRKNGRKNKKIGKDVKKQENKAKKEERKHRRKVSQERRRKERHNMELFMEQQRFKEWKRKESMDILLQKPQAQDAIHDLWKNLFKEGSHWGKIYQDMHQPPQTHRNRGGRPELVRQPLST